MAAATSSFSNSLWQIRQDPVWRDQYSTACSCLTAARGAETVWETGFRSRPESSILKRFDADPLLGQLKHVAQGEIRHYNFEAAIWIQNIQSSHFCYTVFRTVAVLLNRNSMEYTPEFGDNRAVRAVQLKTCAERGDRLVRYSVGGAEGLVAINPLTRQIYELCSNYRQADYIQLADISEEVGTLTPATSPGRLTVIRRFEPAKSSTSLVRLRGAEHLSPEEERVCYAAGRDFLAFVEGVDQSAREYLRQCTAGIQIAMPFPSPVVDITLSYLSSAHGAPRLFP